MMVRLPEHAAKRSRTHQAHKGNTPEAVAAE